MNISPLAGKKAEQNMLVNIPKLVTAYYTGIPDASFAEQRVAFGASGHRGSSFKNSFNENHILAITQAICLYRTEQKIDGPIYLGFDTHALSAPAFATTMEVLAANKVDVMIAEHDEYTPTPVISHAILKYNQGRKTGLADGIVITPSHNPPDDGGFKYNPPNGGPAGTVVTNWIEKKANELLEEDLRNIKRISFDKAIKATTTHRHDYLNTYIKDLGNIIDMDVVRNSNACDTDHDRHGIISKSSGLLDPNHYLSVMIFYLLQHRPLWKMSASIGKTVVTTQLIDRIAAKFGRQLHDVPVGFKWFVDGLLDASLCFVGEESAGATFSRLDGSVWTTDKDGFVPALLSAEMTAKLEQDPSELYEVITKEFGEPFYSRIEAKATPEQKEKLKKLSAEQIKHKYLAGEKIENILTNAPANNASIGGMKVVTENGWFAARPSGTEDIYKIYAESFSGKDHLKQIIEEAHDIVNGALEIKGQTV